MLLVSLLLSLLLLVADWTIPIAGNAYPTASQTTSSLDRTGLAWQNTSDVWSVYFHVDRPAELDLSLEAVPDGDSKITVSTDHHTFPLTLNAKQPKPVSIGRISVRAAGYIRLDFRGTSKTASTFGKLKTLTVRSDTPELTVNFVRNNKGNMFYWGRRGPSVHLTYTVPKDVDLEYSYTELVVPPGEDQIGSYFMANGFSEGYFGMQVNSEDERRILFSVWSPYSTDNPQEIPKDQQIVLLERGPEVKVGEFGNEGSGGQSYLVHPWKAGTICRFLTRVQPAEENSTIYTSWFSDSPTGEWRLIASFRRPKTQTHLKGFHSFLENFNPATGHLTRSVRYQNIQVRDTLGHWSTCTSARLTADATANQKHRLDFAGGTDGNAFFLKNCGFFTPNPAAPRQLHLPDHQSPQPPVLPE